MKRLQLKNFKTQALPSFTVGIVKGGGNDKTFNNFCGWYMNFCGGNPDPGIMNYYMQLDAIYGGNITIHA